MDNKELQKITNNIQFRTDVNGAVCGVLHFEDGYVYSMHAAPDMKSRLAKAYVKENMPIRAIEIAEERNTKVKLKSSSK